MCHNLGILAAVIRDEPCLLLTQSIYVNGLWMLMKPKKAVNANSQSASKSALSFVRDLMRHDRDQKTVQPKPHGGGAVAKISEKEQGLIAEWLKQQPDLALWELCERLEKDCSIQVGISTMWRTLEQMNLSVKKNIECHRSRNRTSARLAICLSALDIQYRPSQFGVCR